jgi:uncharacterized protein DUF559
VTGTSKRRHPGIRTHRSLQLEPQDIRHHRGIPVTSPAWTLLDLATIVSEVALRRAAGRAQSLQRVNLRQVAELLARLGPRPGARRLARLVSTGPAPTRSELEDVVLALVLAGGLRRPDVNVPLMVAVRRVVPDFRWPEQRLIVEADSRTWHEHRIARESDAERQALLEASGERVVRVTWTQAIANREQTLARLRAAGAPLGPRLSPLFA